MIQENLVFVQDNVKYMGFGDRLADQIARNMEQGLPEFTLKADSTYNQKKIEAELHFRKSDKSDMYFFNRYDAELKDDAHNKTRAQTFYLDNGKGITLKEAYNLLEGRSVYKKLENREGEAYNAWLKLDFNAKDKHNNYEVKKYNDNFGFDLDKTLRQFPIKDLESENLTNILKHSLTKGNVQSVTVTVNGKAEKMFIEANPVEKTVNIYDGQMKPLAKEQKQGLMMKDTVKAPVQKQNRKSSLKV